MTWTPARDAGVQYHIRKMYKCGICVKCHTCGTLSHSDSYVFLTYLAAHMARWTRQHVRGLALVDNHMRMNIGPCSRTSLYPHRC